MTRKRSMVRVHSGLPFSVFQLQHDHLACPTAPHSCMSAHVAERDTPIVSESAVADAIYPAFRRRVQAQPSARQLLKLFRDISGLRFQDSPPLELTLVSHSQNWLGTAVTRGATRNSFMKSKAILSYLCSCDSPAPSSCDAPHR